MNKTNITSDNWTAAMKADHPQKVCDLIEVLTHESFSIADLERTRDLAINQPGHFIRSAWKREPGGGCLMYHLSGGRIRSRSALVRWFIGEHEEAERWKNPRYLAPGHLVSCWDSTMDCDRYGDPLGGFNNLSLELLIDTLNQVITMRKASVSPEERPGAAFVSANAKCQYHFNITYERKIQP